MVKYFTITFSSLPKGNILMATNQTVDRLIYSRSEPIRFAKRHSLCGFQNKQQIRIASSKSNYKMVAIWHALKQIDCSSIEIWLDICRREVDLSKQSHIIVSTTIGVERFWRRIGFNLVYFARLIGGQRCHKPASLVWWRRVNVSVSQVRSCESQWPMRGGGGSESFTAPRIWLSLVLYWSLAHSTHTYVLCWPIRRNCVRCQALEFTWMMLQCWQLLESEIRQGILELFHTIKSAQV